MPPDPAPLAKGATTEFAAGRQRPSGPRTSRVSSGRHSPFPSLKLVRTWCTCEVKEPSAFTNRDTNSVVPDCERREVDGSNPRVTGFGVHSPALPGTAERY